MTAKEIRRITDMDTLKAFGHPLRMKLYRALFVARTATASQLAEQMDEAVSLVSYHLRKLADHGLIEEAEPQSADGRERWWQPSSKGVSFRQEDFRDAPEKAAAHASVTRLMFQQRSDLYLRYLDEAQTWGTEWKDAASSSESVTRLSPRELSSLTAEILALIRKYDDEAIAAEAQGDTEGRENVALHVYAFPFRA
ncbi:MULTISPECIES: ArsR/SmtB family transcription factor [unclassified Streptomyces]|uniref:ArsR/SmtB family transcription factor n=1 Tax=unclassified Streptomyces TaxID=2593676 RepID=UPI00381DA68E